MIDKVSAELQKYRQVDELQKYKADRIMNILGEFRATKLVIRAPKSGKEQEIVFIPQKVADRLREYARQKCENPNDRIFPISYEAARIMVLKAGRMVGIHLRPHDLRRFCDIQDRKLIIRDPKSGKEQEVVFIPQKVADRLREYARQKCKNPSDRIFPISYEAARMMVIKAGNMVGIHLRPHDLRRHAAEHASRSGVPIEIISKIILRHANLSTTQLYLGKISDTEAIRWIENIYA